MLFSSLSWVMFTLTLLVALPGAYASSAPKRSKKQASTRVTVETYPSMEDGEIITPPRNPRVQTLGTPAPTSVVKSAPIPVAAPVAPSSPALAAFPAVVRAPVKKFEVVPAEKRGQVLKRMKLCEVLFQETGRAYDYREMTTAQLEKEFAAVQAGRPVATRKILEEAPAKVAEAPAVETPVAEPAADEALGADPILDDAE